MFGALLRIGSKLLGGMRIGSKFLGKAGRIGTKVVGGVNKAFNVASGLPIVGHAIGASPLMQGLRGVVGGLDRVAKATTAAGDVLEKGTSGAASIADTARGLAEQGRRARGAGRTIRHSGRQLPGQARSAARGARASMFNQGDRDTDLGTTRHS
jgi:hypothetical protein